MSDVKIAEKYMLTIPEASKYFNIGEHKLRALMDLYKDEDFILLNGERRLIKRVLFEKFLNKVNSI